MRLRRILVVAVSVLIAAGAAAGAWLGWINLAPRHTPAGQPTLTRLEAGTLSELRETFNASAGRKRILALFSPT
jgi:hypothetical protein